MGYQCANPDCENGTGVQGHHINPFREGGIDAYWNLVSLCHNCHSHVERKEDKEILFIWKCNQELMRFGFFLDEKEVNFRKNFKKAIEIAKNY